MPGSSACASDAAGAERLFQLLEAHRLPIIDVKGTSKFKSTDITSETSETSLVCPSSSRISSSMATRLAHTDKLDADDRPLSTEFHTTILSSALHLHLPATDTREWADLMNSMESVTRRAAATASVHAEGGLAVFLFAFMFEPLNALLDALHLPGRLRWEVDVEHVGGEPRPYVRLIWLPTAGDGAGDDSESAIEAVLVDMMASHALLPQGINDVIEDIGKGGMFVAPDGLTRTKSTGHVRDACGVVDQVRNSIRGRNVSFAALCNGHWCSAVRVQVDEHQKPSKRLAFGRPLELTARPSRNNLAASPLGFFLSLSLLALPRLGVDLGAGGCRARAPARAPVHASARIGLPGTAGLLTPPHSPSRLRIANRVVNCVSNGSSKPLTLIPVGIFHPSGSPVIVDLQAARGRGMIWAGYDATVTAPNGSLHEGLVWKEHIPFFVPTNEQTQRVATSAKNELELLNGPLATLQGRSVPRVFGAWATPDGEAFGMLLEDAGRELTREESEDPGIRAAIIAAVDDILSVGVVHGDLEWRHIRIKRQNGCNRITIIDFDQAYLLDAKEVAAEEDECRDRLAELFDSDLRC